MLFTIRDFGIQFSMYLHIGFLPCFGETSFEIAFVSSSASQQSSSIVVDEWVAFEDRSINFELSIFNIYITVDIIHTYK